MTQMFDPQAARVHTAILAEDDATFEAWLQQGGALDAPLTEDPSSTPLNWAIICGRLRMVERLTEYGASWAASRPDAQGHSFDPLTVLLDATAKDDPGWPRAAVIDLLPRVRLSQGARLRWGSELTSWFKAHHALDLVVALMEQGVRPHKPHEFITALWQLSVAQEGQRWPSALFVEALHVSTDTPFASSGEQLISYYNAQRNHHTLRVNQLGWPHQAVLAGVDQSFSNQPVRPVTPAWHALVGEGLAHSPWSTPAVMGRRQPEPLTARDLARRLQAPELEAVIDRYVSGLALMDELKATLIVPEAKGRRPRL